MILLTIFILLLFGVFGRLLAFGIRATWSILWLLLIICCPIILIVMVIYGLIVFALPVLAIIGLISLFVPRS